jgi:putative Mg2+ transporter-C (MgtC) family protein
MTEYIIRLAIATVLGGLIGLERSFRAKEAGVRTHFLVALGSALFMIVSQYGFEEILAHANVSLDPSRIASQVVTGIGFIGAGTIIFQKHVVRGLTTAAGLWVTSAIGLACGAGMHIVALTATVFALICLEVINLVLRSVGSKHISVSFSTRKKESVTSVLRKMNKEGTDIESYEMKEQESPSGTIYSVSMEVKIKRNHYQTRLIEFMDEFDGVTIDSIE